MSVAFLIITAISLVIMKAASLLIDRRPQDHLFQFLVAPVPSTITWRRRQPATPAVVVRLLITCVATSAIAIALAIAFRRCIAPLQVPMLAKLYLAIIPLYAIAEMMGAIGRACGLLLGQALPPPFCDPLLSTSAADFWGRRYNRWVSDWLAQVIFRPLHRWPVAALFAAFLFSGFWHELLISVPYLLIWRRNIFGWITTYFLIEAAGILLERRLRPADLRLRRIMTWFIILAPAPMIFNPALLRAFLLLPAGVR